MAKERNAGAGAGAGAAQGNGMAKGISRIPPLAVFTFMHFVVYMLVAVFGGILDEVAVALNVSVEDAGLLTTMYAYGAALGVPVAMVVFRRVGRSMLLKAMLALTILTSAALALAQGFALLLAIRFAMGVVSTSYSVLAIATVAAASGKERQGRSMAILIAGNAAALVVGLPLTRALSSVMDWRGLFWAMAGAMALSLAYFALCLPKRGQDAAELDLRGELAFFKDRRALDVVVFTLTLFIGYGALYTYITPYLLGPFPALEPYMEVVLALLGAACFAGNLIGGAVSDRIGYVRAMALGGVLQLASLLMLFMFRHAMLPCLAAAVLWLMSAWFTGLQLNTGIAQATRNKSSLMVGVNNSCIQLGNAVGASIAVAVARVVGMGAIVFVAIAFCVAVLLFHFALMGSSLALRRRGGDLGG